MKQKLIITVLLIILISIPCCTVKSKIIQHEELQKEKIDCKLPFVIDVYRVTHPLMGHTQPVPFVKVFVQSIENPQICRTGITGFVGGTIFTGLEYGDYEITLNRTGYKEKTIVHTYSKERYYADIEIERDYTSVNIFPMTNNIFTNFLSCFPLLQQFLNL